MNKLYSGEGSLGCFYAYPKGLMGLGLNDTDKSVYLLLLDRARLSGRGGDKWRDAQGRVFVYYPVSDLAGDLACSETIVYRALNALAEKDLVLRERQGYGKPNRIYVKLPEAADKAAGRDLNFSADHDLSFSADHDLSFSAGLTSTFPHPNKKERIKKREQEGRRAHFSSFDSDRRPAAPTLEDYQRMQRLLEKLEQRT